MKLVTAIASALGAMQRSKLVGNTEWADNHTFRLEKLMKFMPSGSGFDSGVKLDTDRSTHDKLVFHTSYHHMNDVGYYDGWTDHRITVRPSFEFGLNIHVSGRNRNDIKDYISDVFGEVLNMDVEVY